MAWSAERQREYMKEYRTRNKEALAELGRKHYLRRKEALGIGDRRGPAPKVHTSEELAEKKARKAEYDRAYRQKNAEKLREQRASKDMSKYPSRQKDAVRAYRAKNRDRIVANNAKYRNKDESKAKYVAWRAADMAAFPAKWRERVRLRQRRVHLATPKWADKQAIADVYAEARYFQMEVDHIIPLNHGLVCGLHVWDNLQLLTKSQNCQKGNSFDLETSNAR